MIVIFFLLFLVWKVLYESILTLKRYIKESDEQNKILEEFIKIICKNNLSFTFKNSPYYQKEPIENLEYLSSQDIRFYLEVLEDFLREK